MPENKLIIGYDERDQGRDAVALGLRLAKLIDAVPEVVNVRPYLSSMMGEEAYRAALAEDGERIRATLEEQFSESLEVRVIGALSAARELHHIAESEGAAMIVIGSTHRGAVGRATLGSVGERLLNGAPCPVSVAPSGFADREHFGLGIVGVGYNGTRESKLALETATRIARSLDGKLRLIAVAALIADSGGIAPTADPLAFFKILRGDQERNLEEAKASLPAGVEAESVLQEGNPAAALAAQGIELDLLVLGSRGYGPLRRALLGSVSAAVMEEAPCPVLIVPRGEHADPEARG